MKFFKQLPASDYFEGVTAEKSQYLVSFLDLSAPCDLNLNEMPLRTILAYGPLKKKKIKQGWFFIRFLQ